MLPFQAALLYLTGSKHQGETVLLNVITQDRNCSYISAWKNLATLYGKERNHKKVSSLKNCCT